MSYILLAASLLLVGADRLIKLWAVDNLQGEPLRRFIHFGDFELLNLTYHENTGAIFGSFAGMRIVLIGFTSIMIALCIWFLIARKFKSTVLNISLTLLIAGGIGNLIDRIMQGYVVDYLDFGFFNFAVFNLADICVTVGTTIGVVYILFFDKSESLFPSKKKDGANDA